MQHSTLAKILVLRLVHLPSLLEGELQSEEETAGLCVEVGSVFGICIPPDVCAQSNKGKNEKHIRQLRYFMYL